MKRKIFRELEDFYASNCNESILLTGARQVGKTYAVRELARRCFRHFVEINFIKTPSARDIFKNVDDESDVLVRISAFTDIPLVPGQTLIFFDEVQECPEVVTYIKFLVEDGSYRYVLSGSLLGVELKNLRSAPVGYMRELEMFPMDFEEFSDAVGLRRDLWEVVRECACKRQAVDPVIHEKMKKIFNLYLVVGGMPAAVQKYLDTRSIAEVVKEQKSILAQYRKDAAKYCKERKLDILRVLELLPEDLNKKNKRFVVTDLKPGSRFERLEDNFIWLKEAGIAMPVAAVNDPHVPLRLTRNSSFFKLYMNDVGLLSAMFMDGIQLRLLAGETDINEGAVYENFVAQELTAHGFKEALYFFLVDGGEVDFLVMKDGKVLPIEVKSGRHYRSHASLGKLMKNPDYGIERATVVSNYNFSSVGNIEYQPVYFIAFLSHDELPLEVTYELDL